jgi:hypothetical protein
MAGPTPNRTPRQRTKPAPRSMLCSLSTHTLGRLPFKSSPATGSHMRTGVLLERQDQACCMRLPSVQRRSSG